MAKLSPFGPFRALDNNGNPLSAGKLYTYEAGTSTPKATYTDASGDTQNANPVILDSAGYANVWLGAGGYKFILRTSADVTLWTIDDIGGDSENAFGSGVTSISTNTNVTDVYRNGLIRCTAALTLTLIAAATAEEGFYFLVTNASAGNVTIDPDGAETIDGASTYTLYPNDSVIVICNGSAWFTAFSLPVSGITTNQISTSGSSGVVFKNSGGTTAMTVGPTNTTNVSIAGALTLGTDLALTEGGTGASTASGAFNNIAATLFTDKVLRGLVLSNNVSDATNDIDISAGSCVSDDGTTVMTLSSTMVKQLDASWAVGTNQGGLDTGSIANDVYHVWVINRPDTNVTDVLFSASASAPTLPANYTKKKRIGSIIRASGAILAFKQNGNDFVLDTPVLDYSSGGTAGTSALTATLASVPDGVKVRAHLVLNIVDNGNYVYVSSLDSVDLAPSATVAPLASLGVNATASMAQILVYTNTSGQVRTRQSVNSAGGYRLLTLGWMELGR